MDATALIDATATPIRELGGAFYFAPSTAARGETLGLDVFMFYVLGRGGVLGDVEPDVVVSAFQWLTPSLVRAQWEEGSALVEPAAAAAAYLEAARAYARATFEDAGTLLAFCASAEKVLARAPTGRWPLVDGYRTFELPEDGVARAYQLVVALQELRGAAHGEAITELNLTHAEAIFVTKGDAFELYAFDAQDVPEITDELLERRALAEDRTTQLQVDFFEVLDDVERTAFLEGVRHLASSADVEVEDVSL